MIRGFEISAFEAGPALLRMPSMPKTPAWATKFARAITKPIHRQFEPGNIGYRFSRAVTKSKVGRVVGGWLKSLNRRHVGIGAAVLVTTAVFGLALHWAKKASNDESA